MKRKMDEPEVTGTRNCRITCSRIQGINLAALVDRHCELMERDGKATSVLEPLKKEFDTWMDDQVGVET